MPKTAGYDSLGGLLAHEVGGLPENLWGVT
jgi:hypothetical protein